MEGLGRKCHEVQIGDVGYIDEDGAFRRLFNITVDADHFLNAGGVPQGFAPLKFSENLITVRPRALDAGAYCSNSVKKHDIEGHASA